MKRQVTWTHLSIGLVVALLLAGMVIGGGMSRRGASAHHASNSTSATGAAPTGTYAALGDSVAAGLGLPLSTNASPGDVQCGRSPEGYPNIVATNLGLPLTNVACSGATVGDLFTKQRVEGPNIPAQLTTAFADGTPGLITITAGANDAHWADFIRACYALDCTASGYDPIAQAYQTIMSGKLAYALSEIQSRSHSTPPLTVVTGYYNPLSAACAAQQQGLTADEIAWLSAQTATLNRLIQTIANQYSFARFAPVDFTGHDLCTAEPWIQTFNDPAPFHPNAAGQQSIAASVVSAVYPFRATR